MHEADCRPATGTGEGDLSRADIRDFVEAFYARVRDDEDLGPIFERRIAGQWPAHLDRMVEFWSTVLLGTRSYRGDPMGAHRRIAGLDPSHFSRWMAVFSEVADARLSEAAATEIVGRARRMRRALQAVVCGPDTEEDATRDTTDGSGSDIRSPTYRLPIGGHES